MTDILLAAIPVACIAWTVTQEEVFRELRDWLCSIRDNRAAAWWCRKLAYLPTCHYCFSHYVAAAVVAAFGLTLITTSPLGHVAAWFALVWIANIYITLYHILRQTLKLVGLTAKAREPVGP